MTTGEPTPPGQVSADGYPRYSEAEMARRRGALASMMAERDLAATVVGGPGRVSRYAVQYFTNWPPFNDGSYGLFVRGEPPVLWVPSWNHIPDARLVGLVDDVRQGPMPTAPADGGLAAALAGRIGRQRRLGYLGVPSPGLVASVERQLGTVTWIDLAGPYQDVRLVYSDEELGYLRLAAGMGDRAVAALAGALRPGVREFELAQVIEETYLAERGTNWIHYIMSTPMRNPQVCVPHQCLSGRVLRTGDVVATELSVDYWGYAGQALRSFTIGADPEPRYRDLYDVALAVYSEIVAALRAGVTAGEVLDLAARIHEAGFTICDGLVHGFGGGPVAPGIRTRETGGCPSGEEYTFREGAIVVVQPNVVTRDQRAGVQLGNVVRVGRDSTEVLQHYPMEFQRCG